MSKKEQETQGGVDPVRDPANVQNEDSTQITGQESSAEELKGKEVPDQFQAPKTAAKDPVGLKMSTSPEVHDKMREMASQIATDKDHPLHTLGAGLPFAQAVLNILAILRGVLNTLHDNGLIEKG
jgi:hypothetical protein